MGANTTFIKTNQTGWQLGFKNLFNKENKKWWGSKKWWIHLLVWIIIIDGLLAATLFGLKNLAALSGEFISDAELLETSLQTLFGVATLSISIGIIILSQGEIIGEKQNGTAAWVLSKPASRSAFYLSKLAANLIPMLILMIFLPLSIGYGLITLQGFDIDILNFLLAGIFQVIHTFFYLTLSLLLGIVFNQRGSLLAGTLGCLFGGQLLSGLVKPLLYIGPFGLTQMMPLITLNGISALPNNLWLAGITSLAWSIIFILLALKEIQNVEF